MSTTTQHTCPYCSKTMTVTNSRFVRHSDGQGEVCPLSYQKPPTAGDFDDAYRYRMRFVADLAVQVQDADPTVVWTYLTALPAGEIQRLLMVALAGIPVDKKVREIFDPVNVFPVVRMVNAGSRRSA